MKVKGALWKQFYSDEDYWKGRYHDDVLIRFDRVIQDEYDNPEDDAEVDVESGYVYLQDEEDNGVPLSKFFKQWEKMQSTTTLVVIVDKDYLESAKAEIKQLEGVKGVK